MGKTRTSVSGVYTSSIYHMLGDGKVPVSIFAPEEFTLRSREHPEALLYRNLELRHLSYW
jgi:hypothetical protein